MALIKDVYSLPFFERFTGVLTQVIPSFNKQEFLDKVFHPNFDNLEYKDRMRHTTKVLHQFLPANYTEAVPLIHKIINETKKAGFKESGIAFMFFPDYIETFGLDHFGLSVTAFEFITQFISCEFAVRPFIIKYENDMLKQMDIWSRHEQPSVRRLASEGSRPRLPWAMAIPALKKDPSKILPILENLKNDPNEIVRRSVANNLNDIAKDNPHIVLEIAAKWKGFSKETDAIIKHGSRTLLKTGHTEILNYFDLSGENLLVDDFNIVTPAIKIGENLHFTFSVTNNNATPKVVRVEYGLFYKRQNALFGKKVFKISERPLQPHETIHIVRKQSFRIITTRKFYPGEHKLSIIVNGEEKAIGSFELKQEST